MKHTQQHTRKHTTNDEQLTSQDLRYSKFYNLIRRNDPEMVAYVYQLDLHGKPKLPFWLKDPVDEELPHTLQANGGGKFRIIIRRGRQILFSGNLGFAVPLKYVKNK